MTDTPRFTYAPQGRYWFVIDGETGAAFPQNNEDAARLTAAAANEDPTTLRTGGQTNVPTPQEAV